MNFGLGFLFRNWVAASISVVFASHVHFNF
jgi:hypothetical protein